MAIDVSSWEKTPEGNLKIGTVIAYQTVPMDGNGVGVRIEYLLPATPGRTQPERKAVQVALSTSQARQVANSLRTIAEAIDKVFPPKPRGPAN